MIRMPCIFLPFIPSINKSTFQARSLDFRLSLILATRVHLSTIHPRVIATGLHALLVSYLYIYTIEVLDQIGLRTGLS